jgi:hypothetical protein
MTLPTKANVARPVAAGYGGLIDYGDTDAESLYLRLAVGPQREMQFKTVMPQPGPNVGVRAEDMRGEFGQTFSRSDFTGGEGLDRAHRADGDASDAIRFWDSRNIDVTPGRAGQADEVKLLHAAANIRADDAGNVRMPLVNIGTTLYMVCSSQVDVDRTANPTAATPTFTVEDPHDSEGDQNVLDLAVLGDEVYAAITTNGIHQRSSAGTWSHWSALAATRVWGVKGRIVASTGAGLYVAAAAAGSVLLETLESGQTWTDVVDAGSAIIASASSGELFMFVDEEGELALRRRHPIEGEVPTALGFAQGLLFIGTSESTTAGGKIGRLWRAGLTGLNLRGGQVIRQWGDGTTTLDQSPQRIINTRDSVFTGVIDSATESHLWRYHLSTGGIVRDLILSDGLVQGIAVVDDRLFATVLVEGLWREATTYASTGYLISPLADFFNAADKTWADARLNTGTLTTDTDAVLAYSVNPAAIESSAHASWTTIISADDVTFGDLGPTSILEAESRYIAGKLTLTPNGAATATPTVLGFSFRGLPQPTEEDFAIPVNVSDRLEIPGRKPQTVDGIGQAVVDQLHVLKGQNVTYTDLRSGVEVIGQLAELSQPINEPTKRGSTGVFVLMTIRGVRQ